MSFLNSLLLTLIKALHTLINNYALTIIVFTILIKLVVMPLNLKSRRSTMRMTTIQPKAAALQEKYKDDQEKLNQKLQELYRKEGVNPMGSCLPMLISMVILFAMFYALRTFANEQLVSQFLTFYHNPEIDPHTLVEPFLWIKNLWMPDSPFATYMPDVQSLRLVDYKVWNDVSAKLFADGVCVTDGSGVFARECFCEGAETFLDLCRDAVRAAELRQWSQREYELLSAARGIAVA